MYNVTGPSTSKRRRTTLKRPKVTEEIPESKNPGPDVPDPIYQSSTELLDLDDHCLLEILECLPIFDIHSMALACTRLNPLARQAYKANTQPLDIVKMLRRFESTAQTQFQIFLSTFGAFITEIDFCYKRAIWRQKESYDQAARRNRWIFDCIVKYCGDTLKILRMSYVYMEFPSIGDGQTFFKSLERFSMNRCYDFSLNKAWSHYLRTNKGTLSSQRELLKEYFSNYPRYLPADTLRHLTIENSSLNAETIAALSQLRNLRVLKLLDIGAISTESIELLDNLRQINELIINFGDYGDAFRFLLNLGSTETLERLTINCCYGRDSFLAGLQRFPNLRFLHFGYLDELRMEHFATMTSLANVSEFICEQFGVGTQKIQMDQLESIIGVMRSLTILKLYLELDGGPDVEKMSDDVYKRLVQIYRARGRRLLIRYYRFTTIGDLGISSDVYRANRNFVKICKTHE